MGPAGTGPLACAPAQDLLPNAEAACTGLDAGASCTLGRRGDTATGTCVTPAGGGKAVCVVSCGTLGGCFGPRHGGPGGIDGMDRPGGMDGPGGMGPGGMGH
jgi:hypothetical protein